MAKLVWVVYLFFSRRHFGGLGWVLEATESKAFYVYLGEEARFYWHLDY